MTIPQTSHSTLFYPLHSHINPFLHYRKSDNLTEDARVRAELRAPWLFEGDGEHGAALGADPGVATPAQTADLDVGDHGETVVDRLV